MWVQVSRQANDLTNATATPANTDLLFEFKPGYVYMVDLYLLCTSGLATTGLAFAFDTSVAVTNVALTFWHTLANTGTLTGGQSRGDGAFTGLSSGVDLAGGVTMVAGKGLLVASTTAGTARLQFRPEVAATSTLKAGSAMRVDQV